MRFAERYHPFDLAGDQVILSCLKGTKVDDHVDFVYSVVDRVPDLKQLGRFRILSQGEPDRHADPRWRILEQLDAPAGLGRIDRDGRETVLDRLGTEPLDLFRSAKRRKQRVVDHRGQLARRQAGEVLNVIGMFGHKVFFD